MDGRYTPQNATQFEFANIETKPGTGEIRFSYTVHFDDAESLQFVETITLSDHHWEDTIPDDLKRGILQDLHLVLGISYYKLFCPPEFKTSIILSKKQAFFWNTLYRKGLGEFLYRNGLHGKDLATFASDENASRTVSTFSTDSRSVLVGIGGGKDSIVSLELLRDYTRIGFEVSTGKGSALATEVAAIAGVPLLKITRTLDQQLITGFKDAYSGHVPVSAMYAFLGILQAAVTKQAYVVVSNEHSSNFGNIDYEGEEVNHKWSGSSEFEILMQEYIRQNLTVCIRYFSLTRPFYELRVVKMFTELGQKYFTTFSSCNRNFSHMHDGHTKWCGECPKCAFAFLTLAAFLRPEEVTSIFNKDLLNDVELLPLFKDILGFGTMKPFDCVGTFDESQVALRMASTTWGDRAVVRELLPLISSSTEMDMEVMRTQQAKTVPSTFRMIGMRTALILGYGREGHATEEYLKSRFPEVVVGIVDQSDGLDYLEAQHEYDITIKTPVIPSNLVTRHYTTATNLFFTEVSHDQIIGVTGSKGKSTTSTLIYEMLKKGGKHVRLVGNIGVPALQELIDTSAHPNELFVFELSSYQLEDIDVSPRVAVVTSLFPEHLDHHGSLDAYYGAKQNLIRFQTGQGAYVFPAGEKNLESWASCTSAIAVPVTAALPFSYQTSVLRGEHNFVNTSLAYTVANMFAVSDADVEATIAEYKGLPHRLMFVGVFKGIAFYDDSISTTPESTIAGLRSIPSVHTLILGGVDRGLDFTELEKELRLQGVEVLILFPDTGEHMLVSEEGFMTLHTSDMEAAVKFAYTHTPSGSACLLSPASPSYNLFKNFEERGEQFIAMVKQYGTN